MASELVHRRQTERSITVDVGALIQDQPFAGNDVEVVEAVGVHGASEEVMAKHARLR
jgi:hypothetical protein